jgi:hypothetical protein
VYLSGAPMLVPTKHSVDLAPALAPCLDALRGLAPA